MVSSRTPHVVSRWVPLLIGALLGCLPASSARAASFDLDVSAPVVGDGVSEVSIAIQTPAAGVTPARVRARVNSGTVRVRPDPDGKTYVVFVPPHVVEKRTVNLDVSIAGFSPSLRTARIRVVPPPRALKYRKSSGELSLHLPEFFVLGEHTSATIKLEGVSQKPILSVSTGSVSALRSKKAGVWEATFSPPAVAFPQRVVVVASTEDGSQLHFDHFDLWGRPNIETQSEPGATVRVKVGSQTFGPLQADSRGKVRLMVLAPPGIQDADVTATDTAGNARATQVPLGAPDFNRIHVFCPQHSGRMFIFATTPSGKPLDSYAGALKSNIGTLKNAERITPGFFESEITVPDGTDPEAELTLEAALASSPASRASCVTPVPGEAPTASKLTLGRPEYRPGSGPVKVELKLTYPGERSARPVTVRLTADHGRILDQTRVNPFTTTARWEPTPGFEDVTEVVLRAEVVRMKSLSTQATLLIVADSPSPPPAPRAPVGVLARGGYLTNFGQVSAPFVAVAATLELPFLAQGLAAGVEIGRFSSRRDARTDTAETVSVLARGIPLSTRVTLERRFDRLAPYAGFGLGLVLAHTEVSSATIGQRDEESTLPLARGLTGASYDLPIGKAGIEGGYVYCPMDGKATSGNMCGIDITALYHYPF